MNTQFGSRMRRRLTLAAITLLLLVIVSMPVAQSAVAQDTPPSTVSEIVVDSYDCDTGLLKFHVFVTDLPYVDPNVADGALSYYFVAHYEQGPDFSVPQQQFNPQPQIAPYSGRVDFDLGIPTTQPDGSSDAAVTSIEVGVSGSNSITFTPDCPDTNDDLVQQLIAELIRILRSILNN